MAKRRKKLENATLYVNRINENLYRKVRFLAGMRNWTIRKVVEEALTSYLNNERNRVGGE